MVNVTTSRPRRIVIQSPQAATNTFGQAAPTWTDIGAFWTIDWRTLSGRELMQGQVVQSISTAEITIRYAAGIRIESGYRIRYGHRSFQVNAAINLNEQNQFIRLLVNEL